VPFVEAYLSTPLDVCEARDPKRLYAKARRGGDPGLYRCLVALRAARTGRDRARYSQFDLEESAGRVLEYLLPRVRM
jgi:hypothetical protein